MTSLVPGPRLLVVEHQATCPPALLGVWLADNDCSLVVARPYLGEALPSSLRAEGYDGLLVLGGSMDADDDDGHPWLAPTRALVVAAAEEDVATLGVCLGHQLAALALGGEVVRNPRGQQVGLRRIGWASGEDRLLDGVSGPGVFWNQDVVTRLPDGAAELARADTGELQAARFGARVWGVQWHPEADAALLADWARKDADRHLEQGLDQDRVLAEVEAVRPALAATGRALADRLA
ncbi:type 1 glutamine amidotransferase, partial [Nocardioides sp.]|uniref:type 1 glutamine amidotransferase n=1 Tax=Nocardioides sp. TaxID=35761 RepID=UPI002719BEB3